MTIASPAHYDRRTVWLHWASATLVLLLWCGAHMIDWFPKGPLRVDVRSVHIIGGVFLLGLSIMRVGWRLTGQTRFADAPTVAHRLAQMVHGLLYALIGGVLMLGLANAWVRGDSLFGLFHIPAFGGLAAPARHALGERITHFHALVANGLLILAAGHGGIALYHHIVLRDGVLRRMVLAARPAEPSADGG